MKTANGSVHCGFCQKSTKNNFLRQKLRQTVFMHGFCITYLFIVHDYTNIKKSENKMQDKIYMDEITNHY